jgi:hypothetical protein
MLATAAHNIFRDWATYVSVVLGMLLTAGTIYIRVIYPRAQAHKIHEAERAGLQKALSDKETYRGSFLDGVPEVPGMTPAVKPAAERLRALEDWREQFE